MTVAAAPRIASAIARAIAPRRPLTVSQWADAEMHLSSKGSAEPGRMRVGRNPPMREPMDCLSKGSHVHDIVCIFPIQFGKTLLEQCALGYVMDHDPGPTMVALPDDLSMNKWIAQKLNPMIESTPAIQRALTTTNSRDSANQRTFKDFAGGQLYIEHGKTATRMALTSVRTLLVDELDKFATALTGGEDPIELLNGRTSAFPATYKRCYIGTPGIKSLSRLDEMYESSDRRRYHVPCPHCGHMQPLIWKGLQWSPDGKQCWYACQENGCVIEEHHKTEMIAAGAWIPENPGAKMRGYQLNCLYYQFGLGPRWLDLVEMWRAAQHDPAKLQVFVCERLAESWEDPARRTAKDNVIADRAEPYKLRTAPREVLEVTAGVDTQDNRLAIQIVGWGRGMKSWTLDYDELPGDPNDDAVWTNLTDLLNRPIEHESGALIRVAAVAIDMGGHRTEAVKNFVRRRVVRRPMCIFGAVQNNAAALGKPKLADVNWRGQLDKRGVHIWQVGTVAIKDVLFSRMAGDAEKELADRMVHFSEDLPREFFGGIVSEVFNPAKNRYEKRRGFRNEPLDTYVYAYAAANHPELRLQRRSKADWDACEKRLADSQKSTKENVPHETITPPSDGRSERSAAAKRRPGGFSATRW